MIHSWYYFLFLPENKNTLNTELFIARRVFSQKGNKKGIASKIVSIAVASISLGLAIMIISVSVLLGFKKEVREKVIGFGAHFQIVNYDTNSSYETQPITIDSSLSDEFLNLEHVKHIQKFATKPGIIKTEEAIHGIVLKGVDENYEWSFFQKNMIEGKIPQLFPSKKSNEVLVSQKVAKLLKLDVNDKLYCYFYNEGDSKPRSRRFTISGIYSSSFNEFDELFVLGDIKQVKQLNGWHSSEISGYEILIDDFKLLEEVFIQLREIALFNASESSILRVYSIVKKYPMLFDWLSVLDLNVWVLMVLMIAVAGINMISGLLIVIIERTRMIGTLKAMGYPNIKIRKVFLYLSAFLSLRGLLWGNLIGIGFCIFQYTTGILTLDPVSYYLDTVPIVFNFPYIILLNVGTLLAIVAMIILPSIFISKISPVDAISFE
ncbi:MAG: ABC transporter permease [Prolixibacteraceae bacterium]|jgi:lipoprotein-releasing system permease protein|nr:ABC transporter permease [Prolixibacteraceae bacterium]